MWVFDPDIFVKGLTFSWNWTDFNLHKKKYGSMTTRAYNKI